MQNQSSLLPVRALFEELRQNEDAGSLDTWPASREADGQARANEARTAAAASFPAPDEIPELTPELATRRSAATGHGELAAILRLQSTEIERLALENDRLAACLDAVHQRHDTEQNQRRDLEQLLRAANARNETPAPAFDVEDVRRAAREGMSTEIKPVLVAILDLLETTMSRTAGTAAPAAADAPVSAPAPVNLFAEVKDEFHRLPDILTRPLEELMARSGNFDPAPDRFVEVPVPTAPRAPREQRPRPPRHEAQPSAIPGVFAWTNLQF